MKFGLFYEHQLPRPWTDDSEYDLLQHAIAQCELADSIGIDSVWAVEHHFLEEYSHSSAPEVFLAAVAIGLYVIWSVPTLSDDAPRAPRTLA